MQLNFRPDLNFPQKNSTQFGMKKLYTPIGSGSQDGFKKSNFYKPIAPPPPSLPLTQLEPVVKPEPGNKITKAEFLEVDLREAEQRNIALTESFRRKINIQSGLDLVMRSAASLIAMVGTKGWAAPLLPFINSISAKISDWSANKIKDSTLGRTIDVTVNICKRGFNKLLSLFDSKETKSVRFSGNGSKVETTQQAEQHLLGRLFNATERFTQQLNNPQRLESKEQMVSQLYRDYFSAIQLFINTQGSIQDKVKMAKLAQLSTEIQEISKAIPASAIVFNDIPAPVRRQLLSIVYDALVIGIPEMTQWGESIALELGITQDRINQIKL